MMMCAGASMRQSMRPFLREVRPGRETLENGLAMPRHRHLDAYALVVVSGAVDQASYAGRVRLRAGEILVQPTLDCHSNGTIGAQVLRLPWPVVEGLGGAYRLANLDEVVRVAECDPVEASFMAQAAVARDARCGAEGDWPDLLANDLARGCVDRLNEWADGHALQPETLSRGFARAYGIGPAAFARELKVRAAWLKIARTRHSFAMIAAEAGFADQAHMTRMMRAVTGATPSAWRAAALS
jgi:AraC-like DNA-binding protein